MTETINEAAKTTAAVSKVEVDAILISMAGDLRKIRRDKLSHRKVQEAIVEARVKIQRL